MSLLKHAIAKLDHAIGCYQDCKAGMSIEDAGDCKDLSATVDRLRRHCNEVERELASQVNHLETMAKLGGKS